MNFSLLRTEVLRLDREQRRIHQHRPRLQAPVRAIRRSAASRHPPYGMILDTHSALAFIGLTSPRRTLKALSCRLWRRWVSIKGKLEVGSPDREGWREPSHWKNTAFGASGNYKNGKPGTGWGVSRPAACVCVYTRVDRPEHDYLDALHTYVAGHCSRLYRNLCQSLRLLRHADVKL